MLLVIGLSSNIFLLVSQMNENWELAMLVLWALFDSFASAFLMLFLATTYVFDLVKTENRYVTLSSLSITYSRSIFQVQFPQHNVRMWGPG